jgi:hypothetical protein
VRLVGDGATGYQGRLELQESTDYAGRELSEWYTVCGSSLNFTAREAAVVCNQLGYPGKAQVKEYAAFGKGSSNYIVEFPQYACSGTEQDLNSCRAWVGRTRAGGGSSWSYTNSSGTRCADHTYDVGVVCTASSGGSGALIAAIVVPVVVGAALLAAAGAWFVLRRKNQEQKGGAGAGGAEEGTMVTIPALAAAPAAAARVGEASAAVEPVAVRVGEASGAAMAAASGDAGAVQSAGSGLGSGIKI